MRRDTENEAVKPVEGAQPQVEISTVIAPAVPAARTADWAREWIRLSKESFIRMDCAHEAENLELAVAALVAEARSTRPCFTCGLPYDLTPAGIASHKCKCAKCGQNLVREDATGVLFYLDCDPLPMAEAIYDPFGPDSQIPERESRPMTEAEIDAAEEDQARRERAEEVAE